MVERIVLVHSDRGAEVDGIRDYSRKLAEALQAGGATVQVRDRTGGGRELGRETALVLQYNPFSFGRWGFAPRLPAWLVSLRARRRRPTIAVMVHEPYVPMNSWKWRLMGLWQRLQLALVRSAADVTFASIEAWAGDLERQPPGGVVRHLPVGSNFPDGRRAREAERARLGVEEEGIVVAALGNDHPSWLTGHLVAGVNAIAATGRGTTLLLLGASAPLPDGLHANVVVHRPGFLDEEEFAVRIASADLFVAPLIDGVSTRRGSVMAALQHGVPVLATDGELTDPGFRKTGDAVSLVPVSDLEAFAEAARRLGEDPAQRATRGRAARELYEREFDWPVIARRLTAGLEGR